jgi:acetyltransferase
MDSSSIQKSSSINAMAGSLTDQKPHFLDKLMNPKSVAFFGANGNLVQNIASQQLINLFENNYKGKIYPIHPKLDTVFGSKAYKSVLDVPETPDVAMVVVNKKLVPQIFEELHQKGCHNVILVTAGFREAGDSSAEEKLQELANMYDIRFLGPNCIGVLNTHSRYTNDPNLTCVFNCTSVTYHGTDCESQNSQRPGNVSIISQSGTWASHIFFNSEDLLLDWSKSISIGNERNVDMVDCLEYLENDPTTDVILIYIEEIKRGKAFFETAKRVSLKKPIIALYVGGSAAGAKAASSHTGSLAGNDTIFNAMFKQSGIIRVYNYEEMMNTAHIFSKMVPVGAIPRGKRLAIATTSGGPGATMSDFACRHGIEMPQFSEETAKNIKKYLVEIANCQNPLDFTFTLDANSYYNKIPQIIGKSGEFDMLICYGAFGVKYFNYMSIGKNFFEGPQTRQAIEMYAEIQKDSIDLALKTVKKQKFPMIFVNPLGNRDELFGVLNKKGLPTYQWPEQAVQSALHLMEYGDFLNRMEKRLGHKISESPILDIQ